MHVFNRYLDRRVPRSEAAKRLSYMDTQYLSRVITKWFWDTVNMNNIIEISTKLFVGSFGCSLGTSPWIDDFEPL